MYGLRKRFLSLASAAAMVVSLLPTTTLFASADNSITILDSVIQFDGDTWGSETKSFEISNAGECTFVLKYQGNAGAYFKMKLDNVDNALWDEGSWVNDACGHNEWSEQFTKEATRKLSAGEHTVTFEGNKYAKYISLTVTEPESANGDTPSEGKYAILLSTSTSNGGSISGSVDGTEFEPQQTVILPTATANSGYKFSGWTAKKGTVTNNGDGTYSYTFPKDAPADPTKATLEVIAVFEKTISTIRDLPIVSVTTKNEVDTPNTAAEKEKEITSWVSVSNVSNSIAKELSGQLATIRGRGNSTWTAGITYGKKPYRLKFDSKTVMLDGTNKNKKWVLLANLVDTSLLRNQVAMEFSKTYMTNIPFTTAVQQVELWLNGEFQGVYTLCEQSEVASGRVDIDCPAGDDEYSSEYSPTDEKLAFFIERDADATNEDFYFQANGDEKKAQLYTVKEGAATNPAYEGQKQTDANNVYVKAIKDYINKVDDAIISKNQTNISNLIDVNSFVDMYILQELAKNCDVGAASFYLTKAQGGKLQASPPWDFDRAFGNDTRGDGWEGLYVAGDYSIGNSQPEDFNVSRWYRELCSQSWFVTAIKTRFTELYNSGAFKAITDDYDWNKWKTSTSVAANVDKFGTAKNYSEFYGMVASKGSYSDEVNWLQTWITERVKVLKSAYYDDSIKYTVTAVSADSNMGTATAVRTESNTFTLTATANSGYKFVNWTDPNNNVVGTNSTMTYDAAADITLTANFEVNTDTVANPQEIYAITDNENIAEHISGSTDVKVDNDFLNVNSQNNYAYGIPFEVDDTSASTTYTIEVYAQGQGGPYAIVWNGSKTEVESQSLTSGNWNALKTTPTTFTITGDNLSMGTNYAGVKANEYINLYKVVVTKTTAATKYTVAANAGTGGTASVDKSSVESGTQVTFTATANSGYEFEKWTDSNGTTVSTSASYTATITEDTTLTANFKVKQEESSSQADSSSQQESSSQEDSSSQQETNYTLTLYADDYADYKYSDNGSQQAIPFEVLDTTQDITVTVNYSGNSWVNIFAPASSNLSVFQGDKVTSDFEGSPKTYYVKTDGAYTFTIPAGSPTGIYYAGVSANDSFDLVTITYSVENAVAEVSAAATVNVTASLAVGGVVVDSNGNVVSGSTARSGQTLTAKARGAYEFVNWTDSEGTVLGTNATLSNVTSDVTANFKKQDGYIVLEAENYTELVSEKGTRVDETPVDNQDTNETPLEGQSAYASAKEGAIPFSGGQAVKLMGDSKAIAIPFTIPANNVETEVFVGYNYGVLSATKDKNDGDSGLASGLWINIYVPKSAVKDFTDDQWTAFKAVWTSIGWEDNGALQAPVSPFKNDDGDGYDQKFGYVFYKHLDDNDVQETSVKIPANAGEGQYYISVATDGDINSDEYSKVGNGQNIGYYDYLMVKEAAKEDEGKEVTFGANFYYIDQFGNALASNEFSDTQVVYENEQLVVKFKPKAPRFLIIQGWKFLGWDVYEGRVTVDATTGQLTYPGERIARYKAENGNEDIDNVSDDLISVEYESGKTMTFVARYEVGGPDKKLSVDGVGKIYVKKNAADTVYEYETNGSVKVPNFGKVRLYAPAERKISDSVTEYFDHWELNGMIYSCDREFYFMAWTDGTFTPVYEVEKVEKAVAFIDAEKDDDEICKNVSMVGFESSDTNYHKITFDCAYYVPSDAEYVSSGIIYSNNESIVKSVNEDNTTISSDGKITTTVGKIIVTTNKSYLLLTNDGNQNYNRQVMVSISGVKNNVIRSARAYLVYKDSQDDLKVVFSNDAATVLTPEAE